MTATLNHHVSSRPRRSLNDTIGRLDDMIDGLSEAIPGTIRDTLQETVGAAVAEGVRTALSELLTNPDVLMLFRSAVTTQPSPVPTAELANTSGPTLLAKIRSGLAKTGQWLGGKIVGAGQALAGLGGRVLTLVTSLKQRLAALRPAGKPLLVALLVGTLAAMVGFDAPTWVAVLLSGLGGAGVTLAVQLGLWLRRSFGHVLVTAD
jgi:predicted permease